MSVCLAQSSSLHRRSLSHPQSYQILTKFLIARYGEGQLLGVEYSEEEVVVRSSDLDRTLMSASAALAGE